MGKALALGEAIIVIKGLWDSGEDFLTKLVPNDFYKSLDKLAFLDAEFLAIGNNGVIIDNTKKIAEAIMNLSNFVIWGILLFYAFKSLFGYFMTKRFDIPWKFFIRMIVFGILANSAFFICYTGIFFTENSTAYIRNYVGENKISFECMKDFVNEDVLNEENKVYTFDALASIFIYFSTFFLSVTLGGRYLIIKVLILFSPVFFVLGGFKESEKIFFGWCKKFCGLLVLQIFLIGILGVVNLCDLDGQLFSQLLICGMIFLFCKNIFSFLKFLY